jgi:putative addiction module component (TIGR02574 family)
MLRVRYPSGEQPVQQLSAEDLARLTPEQKADLIDQLWASWEQDSWALSEAQRLELDRRLDDLQTNPDDEVSWPELKAELLSKDH